jgi:hypothetical protein
LQPSPNKIHQRWDSQGNSLPIRPNIPPGWAYRPSSDGVGVLAPQEMFRPRDLTVDQVNMIHTQQLNEADQAYEEGFFATALYVLREAYWYNWTDSEIAPEISSRLIQVYNALGRGKLAVVVEYRSKI